jgi:hypothetical protein
LGPIPRNPCFVLFVIVFAAVCTPAADAPATWLDRLNFYRSAAALPPVTEEPSLSAPVSLHARYMVLHDVIIHSEKRRHAEASAEGAAAAAVSNLAGSLRADEPDAWAVDTWMQGPFHAIGILDPALRQVGFGIHRAHNGRIQTAAGLDVIRGRAASVPPFFSYPVVWPADGTTVPLSEGIEEYPNPLSSCRGFKAPTGLPLIVQVGSGDGVPQVTGSRLFDGARPLAHCVFDESTYRNGNKAEQRLGRSILAARDAIVLIPRDPLTRGRSYRAIIDVDGRQIDWTFSVGSSLPTGETP